VVPVRIWRHRTWCQRHIGDLVDFGNNTLEEGDTDWIDVDGGSTDWINDEEEVLRSDSIGVENTGDHGGFDNSAHPNGGALKN
jgi:hypothetical protein